MSTIVPNPTLTATGDVSASSGANSSVHKIMGNTFYDWKDNFTYSFFPDPPDESDAEDRTFSSVLFISGMLFAIPVFIKRRRNLR